MRGPSPAHQPTFPTDFLAEADALLRRRTAPAHLRQRAALAALLHREPQLPHPEAAARLGLQPVTVRKWRRRWARGDFSLADQPGRGRKARFSPPGPGGHHGRRL